MHKDFSWKPLMNVFVGIIRIALPSDSISSWWSAHDSSTRQSRKRRSGEMWRTGGPPATDGNRNDRIRRWHRRRSHDTRSPSNRRLKETFNLRQHIVSRFISGSVDCVNQKERSVQCSVNSLVI